MLAVMVVPIFSPSTEHHGRGYLEGYPALAGHHQCQGHCGAGGLEDDGQDGTDKYKNQNGEESPVGPPLDKCQDLRVGAQVRNGVLEVRKAQEKEGKAYDHLSYALALLGLEHHEYKSETYQRDGEHRDVCRESQQGYKPGGDSRSDIGTHYHAYGLGQAQQTRIDEADYHHGRGTRGLDDGCDEGSGQNTGEGVGRHGRKNGTQAVAGYFLEALAHQRHAVEKEAQGSQQSQYLEYGAHISLDFFKIMQI